MTTGMKFGQNKCIKVTLAKFKNITFDIKTEIAELEINKTYKNLRINEVNRINHIINKEK